MSVNRAARLLRGVMAAALGVALAGALSSCVEHPLPSSPVAVESGPLRTLYPKQTPTAVPSLTESQTAGLESTPWELVHVDGHSLTVRYVAGGGCSVFKGVRVAETATSVEIWATVKTDRGAQACADYLATGATTIQLSSALGTRRLLHAPISTDWKALINNF